jgi:hypothetical protein
MGWLAGRSPAVCGAARVCEVCVAGVWVRAREGKGAWGARPQGARTRSACGASRGPVHAGGAVEWGPRGRRPAGRPDQGSRRGRALKNTGCAAAARARAQARARPRAGLLLRAGAAAAAAAGGVGGGDPRVLQQLRRGGPLRGVDLAGAERRGRGAVRQQRQAAGPGGASRPLPALLPSGRAPRPVAAHAPMPSQTSTTHPPPTCRQRSRKSAAVALMPGGRGGPSALRAIANIAAQRLSRSGQGCCPVSISRTVQPSDHTSARRPCERGEAVVVAGQGGRAVGSGQTRASAGAASRFERCSGGAPQTQLSRTPAPRPLTVAGALDDLGRHPEHAAAQRLHRVGARRVAVRLGGAEVCELDDAVARHQHVGALDVPAGLPQRRR